MIMHYATTNSNRMPPHTISEEVKVRLLPESVAVIVKPVWFSASFRKNPPEWIKNGIALALDAGDPHSKMPFWY